jgi:hypothetical protein
MVAMKGAKPLPGQATERMNAIVDATGVSRDPFSRAAARRVLERVDW